MFSFEPAKLVGKEQRQALINRVFKRLFIDDWVMKLVALVITLTLWLGVTGLQTPTTTRIRGVSLNLLIANDLEVTNSPVEDVDLVLRGVKQRLDQILPRDLAVSLDLTDIEKGDRTVQITPQNISVDLPSGVEVIEVQPDKIAVKLEEVAEVVVPIRVETDGRVASGYELYGTRLTPESVRVRGPASFVGDLSFVSTEKIDISGKKEGFSIQQIPLTVVNPKIILVSAATANVNVRIGLRRIERLISLPYQTESRNGRAQIVLFGPSDLVRELSAEDITIVEERSDDGRSRLRVELPAEVQADVEVKDAKFRE